MRRRYKLLHLITRLDLGGAQQNTLFCAAHHDRNRFDVALAAGAGGLLDAEAMKLTDTDVRLLPFLRHPVSLRSDLETVFRLRNRFRAEGVDLLHTHGSKAGILGRLAAALAGVPAVVHTAHGWSFNETQSPWVRRFYITLERMAAGLCDRLITVSARMRQQGLALGIGHRSQYAVVHSGIDVERYRRPGRDRETVRRELGIEPRQQLVGTVACLKAQKAPLDFVRAAAEAHARCDRLRFIIAGDGELREPVNALVRELGLEGVVQLLGWRRDVPDLLHAMDLFLLTSRFEGLPRVVLQAMAAGCPVVATEVDGTPEVIEHGRTGLLTPPGDPSAAAARLVELAGNEPLRRKLAAQAGHSLGARFDIHLMVRELEGIYISALEHGYGKGRRNSRVRAGGAAGLRRQRAGQP